VRIVNPGEGSVKQPGTRPRRSARSRREYRPRIVTASKPDRAYSTVRRRVIDGSYAPGQRIVLPTVAAELEMSTVPVREALRRLEAEGLVEFTRWAGARVAAFDERQLGESIEAAGDLTAARDSDRSFHAAVHARCSNRMLVTLVQIAYGRMDTLRNVFEHRPQRIGHAADDHDRLIGLLEGQPSAAQVERAFRRHGLEAAAEIAGSP
jgi:DNA-binding GntR family transcriptional regulator